MKKVIFEYRDNNGEWKRQSCCISTVAGIKKFYGNGVKRDYRIVKVEDYRK